MRIRRPPAGVAAAAILLTLVMAGLGALVRWARVRSVAPLRPGPTVIRPPTCCSATNVYYPYSPATPRPIQTRLNAIMAKARAQGFPIKVALIAAPTDLGVIPDLFGKPESYAKFLDQEISFQGRQRLLVVMTAGYGTQGFAGPAQSALGTLARPDGRTAAALARAAMAAVPRLAAAAGHPIRGLPATGSSDGGSGGNRTVVAAAWPWPRCSSPERCSRYAGAPPRRRRAGRPSNPSGVARPAAPAARKCRRPRARPGRGPRRAEHLDRDLLGDHPAVTVRARPAARAGPGPRPRTAAAGSRRTRAPAPSSAA